MQIAVASTKDSRALRYRKPDAGNLLRTSLRVKTFFALFVLLVVALAIYPFLNPPENGDTVTGLPWQIEILPDGTSQVFGLHIGSSRLSDAFDIHGDDMELAIIAATDEIGKLEMYYGHYQAGLLSGKLVLHTGSSEQNIKRWRENAAKSEYMASGQAKKYILSDDDSVQVMQEVITGITFLPAVNLDEAVILARFGEPEKHIVQPEATHYLYPAKGLDIVLYEEAKEVLQYVSPDAFQQLTRPLLAH